MTNEQWEKRLHLLLLAPGHKQRLVPFRHRFDLVLLDGARRVDVLRTDPRAFAVEGSAPYAFMLRKAVQSPFGALVARVLVVALRQRDGRRAYEMLVQADDGARGVAAEAIDAHAELLVALQLLRRLQVFALGDRLLFLADDPG